jgi:hypothetical protein
MWFRVVGPIRGVECAASQGLSYFCAVDLTAGIFPAGRFFGLDVAMGGRLGQFSVEAPFTAVSAASGASTSGLIGPTPTISGFTWYAVTTEWTPGFSALTQTRPAQPYTVP